MTKIIIFFVIISFMPSISFADEIRFGVIDVSYDTLWDSIIHKLSNTKLIVRDKKRGIIESDITQIPLYGIIGFNYKEESQKFIINLKEIKPLHISIGINVQIRRLNKAGKWIKVEDTTEYQQALFDFISSK